MADTVLMRGITEEASWLSADTSVMGVSAALALYGVHEFDSG